MSKTKLDILLDKYQINKSWLISACQLWNNHTSFENAKKRKFSYEERREIEQSLLTLANALKGFNVNEKELKQREPQKRAKTSPLSVLYEDLHLNKTWLASQLDLTVQQFCYHEARGFSEEMKAQIERALNSLGSILKEYVLSDTMKEEELRQVVKGNKISIAWLTKESQIAETPTGLDYALKRGLKKEEQSKLRKALKKICDSFESFSFDNDNYIPNH